MNTANGWLAHELLRQTSKVFRAIILGMSYSSCSDGELFTFGLVTKAFDNPSVPGNSQIHAESCRPFGFALLTQENDTASDVRGAVLLSLVSVFTKLLFPLPLAPTMYMKDSLPSAESHYEKSCQQGMIACAGLHVNNQVHHDIESEWY
jgi:hypothetical protein